MDSFENALRSSRVVADARRVSFDAFERRCHVCFKELQGLHRPYGITQVCSADACVTAAQFRDKGGQKALMPGTKKPWYCGIVIAYQGNNEWAVGFVHDVPEKRCDWIKNVPFVEVTALLDKHKGRVMRKEDAEIFGYVKAPE